MRRLRALDISEERRLGGVVAGLLYLTGSATVCLILLLPGVETHYAGAVVGLALAGAVWGVAALVVVRWDEASPLVSHLSTAAGIPITGVAMALTGGASSPARFWLFFIVVYVAYFYPPREAIPYIAACAGTIALPLLYDPDAIEQGALAELVVLTPTFAVLGGLIMAGKSLLVDLSRHDVLTGLVNRRAFGEHLDRHVGGRRASDALGLLLVDLDSFKDANTRYGHPAGDAVLQAASGALRSAVRAEDLVARLGGDEFAVIVLGADEELMRSLAGRLRDELRSADDALALPEFTLSASIGWALCPRDGTRMDELIAIADVALRRAKETGKDRFVSPADWASGPTAA
jgi:diguanylate cyclase (GGDEF)-like protein